jgi:hypothetical protein
MIFDAGPPPELLTEIDYAWARAMQLAEQDRELHFSHYAASGRLVIELRTLSGDVLERIAPSDALDIMGGAPL